MTNKIKETIRFALIGSGRVASQLAHALIEGGASCIGVQSRTPEHAQALAKKLETDSYSTTPELAEKAMEEQADLLVISINDDAISEVVETLPRDFSPMVVHTSGSTPMQAVSRIARHGVLYPMQTFSPDRKVEISEVPFLIEASDEKGYQLLEKLLSSIVSPTLVRRLQSDDRARLHLASVFACNFVNHMYAAADEVLDMIGLDFSLLSPLIRETLEKALEYPPASVQTGPAVRGDQKTLERHLDLLTDKPELQELYTSVSQSITNKHSTPKQHE